MNKEDIKIVGIIDESPFHPLTWSGISYYFFTALERSKVLMKAISAELSKGEDLYYKAVTFHPYYPTWRFKYQISTKRYAAMTKKIRNELNSIDNSSFSFILQVGAWYDATDFRDKITASYHDGNIARLIDSPYHKVPFVDSYVSKAFNHERELYSRMHLIFTMSRWLADSFIRDFGVDPKKVFPVGAGINLPTLTIKDLCDKDYSTPAILFVGKDFKRKGGEYLVKAFKLVKKEIPQATLTIIGPSIDLQEEGIRVLGPVSKMTQEGINRITKAYKDASVFVMPSLYEPFGIAFCEAMAFGLPCIGTNICAMPEIISHEKSGLLVPPCDERELSKALISLLKSPSLCAEMGKEGSKRFRNYFTWDAVVGKIMGVLSARY